MAQTQVISATNALSFSSFGAEQTTFGNGWSPRTLLSGDRFAELDYRESYYACTQHAKKPFDFEGRVVKGPRSTQPLIGAEKASWYVPLSMRRPSMPYRVAKIIVDGFTAILFGENRFPTLRVEGDEQTEDFVQTVCRIGRLPLKMIQARNIGGATGSVGMSWCFYEGKPRFEVHNPKHIFVHSWEDRPNLIPRHVSEVYPFYKVEWDGKGFNKVWYWFRRDWTADWDVVFKDVKFEQGKDPFWIPDDRKSTNHNDGLNHFVWIQNLPSDEIDGISDYEGLFESFDAIDLLYSVVTRGAVLNLDPTLKLKMDPDLVNRMGVKKGSDNSLVVGKDGDADYMELSGTSIDAGVKLLEAMRRSILETAQCIVPDPNAVAAQGTSSVAMKMMYAPMLAKADVHREQYGGGIERLLEGPVTVAREASKSRAIITSADGKQEEGKFALELPQKIDKEPILGPDGKPTGEDKVTKTDRMPGEGGDTSLRWPPYFLPTADDQNKVATTLQLATGGKSFLSRKSAIDLAATTFGVDPAAEQDRVDDQSHADKQEQAAMLGGGDAGGQVPDENTLPPGARPRRGFGGAPKPNPMPNPQPKLAPPGGTKPEEE